MKTNQSSLQSGVTQSLNIGIVVVLTFGTMRIGPAPRTQATTMIKELK
jgi:hypothetical protein